MEAVPPLPWLACVPSSMTGHARSCQPGEPADTLLLLASVGLPALELCVPFFTADLPMSDQVLQTSLGKLCPALQWMTSQGWTGSGEPGQGSCPPFFHGWPLQGQTSPNETV